MDDPPQTHEPQDTDLPKALVKRLIKTSLQDADRERGGDGTRDFQVNKDALLAFSEAGKLFIHYLTATANDICKEAKRQTISADDVITALTDLEFPEFVGPLKEALDEYRAEVKEKNRKKAEASKKRKSGPETAAPEVEGEGEGGEAAAAAAAEEGDGGDNKHNHEAQSQDTNTAEGDG